jgi:hypothetical protein
MSSKYPIISKFSIYCGMFLIVFGGITLSSNHRDLEGNMSTKTIPKSSFYPSELTWGIGWGTENVDVTKDVWANEKAIYVVGSIEHNTTYSKLMLSKFTQSIHMQREQVWSINWSSGPATFGKGVWSNGTDIYTVGQYDNNFVLIKWDVNGTEIWNSTWNLDGKFGNIHSIWGNNDEIYACGVYVDDLVLIKWNNNGMQLWNRTWGGIEWDEGFDIWGNESDIYTCGSTSSFGVGSNDSLIIRWDSDGNQLWNSTWGKNYEDYFTSIYGIGNELYTCGSTWSINESSTDVLIMKWFTNGTRDWKKVTGESRDDIGNSIWANDYHVYVGGTTYEKEEDFEEGDQLILKYTFSGKLEEKLTWGGIYNETCDGIYVINDNLYSVGTYTYHQSHYIIRYFSYNLIQPPDILPITPNPCVNGSFFIEWVEVPGAEHYNIYKDIHPILDISNRTPYLSISTTNFTEFGVEEGTYFYVITTIMRGTESEISLPRIVDVYFPATSRRIIPGYNIIIVLSLLGISAVRFYKKKRLTKMWF